MFYYLWPHIVYHLVRWFERNNRRKIQIVLWILSASFIVPPFYILYLPESARYCDQPLLDMVVVSIVFSFLMFGFVVLLSLMEPLPAEVRWAFHVFGVVCLVEGIVHSVMTWSSLTCETTVEALYFWSLAMTVLITVSTGIFVLLVPFWLVNYFRGQSVLNRTEKSGVCFQPTMCCSCLWHV